MTDQFSTTYGVKMANPLDRDETPARGRRGGLRDIEGIAIESGLPANLLLAVAENAPDADGALGLAREMAAAYSPRIRAGEDIQAILRAEAPDHAEAIIGRARQIGEQIYPEQMRAAREAAERAAQERRANEPGVLGDFRRAITAGAVEGIGSVVEGAGILADQPLSLLRDDETYVPGALARGGAAVGDAARRMSEGLRGGMSEDSRRAMADSTPDGDLFDPSTWSAGDDPSPRGYLLHFGSTLGSLVPVIATGVAGRVAAMGGRATAMAAGAVGGAQAAGDGAGTAAGIIEEAFQRRGEDGRSALEAASPLFQEFRAQGRSEEEAFTAVRDEAARFGAMLQAPIGAVSGGFVGAAARGLNPVINRMPGGPLSRAMRAGLATAFEEGASEAAEGAAARFGAQVASGMDVNETEGTFGDFVLGAMGGGPVGAVAGAAPGAPHRAGGGDDDERGTGSGVVVSPEPAAPGGSGEGVASTPIAEPAAGRDEQRLARVRVQLRGERQAWDGEIIGEMGDVIQIRAADGQIYDVPRAEIESGDVILTALEGGGPPPARVDTPLPPAADRTAEDFGIGGEPEPEQADSQPMTTDDARRLLDAIEARARRQGWDDEMTAAAAQLRDAIERGTTPDPALAQSTATQIGRSDGSPFPDEASARRALGKLGISAGGYDVVLTEGGYVARPKLDLRNGMAGGDGGTRPLGIDDGGASRRPRIGAEPVIRDGGEDPARQPALPDDRGGVPDAAAPGEPAPAVNVQQNEQPLPQEAVPAAPKAPKVQPVVENIRARAAVLRGVPQDAPPSVPGVSLKWDDREAGFTFNHKHVDAVRAAVGLGQPEGNSLRVRNIPAVEKSANGGEGQALVTVTDVYGDKHRVRQSDLDSNRRLLPRFNRNGEKMDSPGLARDNIDQDGKGVTKTWASSQIIGGGRSADLPLADRSAVRRAILRRGQKVEDFDIKPVRGGMIGVRKAAQNAPVELAVSGVTAAALQTQKNPTQAQAEAENYRTGKAGWNGLTLSIENAKGSTRRGTGPDGTEWSVEMPAHYGRILGTRGADGDHVDFYMGDDETSDFALIVNQIDPSTGSFDEHKVILGAKDRAEAMRIYESGFSDGSGPRRAGSVSEHSVDDLKAWLASGDMTNPTQPVKNPGGKQERAASSPAPAPAPEANTPDPSPARSGDARQTKPRTNKAQRAREAHLDRLAEYFAPGNIVRTYGGGHDRVISFDRGTNGEWTATVQAVSRKGDAWVDAPNERVRTHRTEPEARDLRAGPVLVADAQAPEDAAPQPSMAPAFKAKIEDFGEKIGGAKKDLWTGYAQKLAESENYDLAKDPLSKTWPEPDYEALIREGADAWSVAFVRAARDTVPRKPSSSWKARRWVEQVRVLRGMARQVLSGDYERAQIDDKMVGSASLQRLRNTISLYETFGHAKSLKGLVFRESKYSVYGGQRFPNGKSIWEITQEQKATAFSNMPRVLAKGDTREEAIDAFRPVHEAMSAAGETKDQAKADRRAKFVIWSLRGETPRTYIVGTKIGSNHIPLRDGIADVAEARRIVAEEADQLQAQLDRMRDIPRERRETNEPRVGVDHRDGADVTPEMFQEAFGFRGVEFGNYVEGRRRQEDLNNAYDALMDLAGIVGVPSKALSLNGSLGLAFGARGSGGKNAAAAHFEPGKIVINLTKTQGRGALAHEWFHAVDNYFARQRLPMKGTYITDNATPGGASVPGIRPEVVDAFLGVRAAIAKTKLKERSGRIDKLRPSPYWGTGIEMHARAFESYVVAKLQDQSAANDYLANLVNGQMWGLKAEASGLGDSYPYLKPDEIEAVRPAFDALFRTIETRQSDRGVEMYSRGRTPSNRADRQADPEGDPVASLTGAELGVAFRGGEDMPALRRAAQAWYLDNLAGQIAITRDGVEVRFTKRGMRKSVSGNKGDTLLRSVPAIRAIVEKGVVVFREPGRAHVLERIIIAAPVSLAGKTSNLAVSVHRTADGSLQYDFTFNRDAAGRSGDGVPDGHATESRRSAFDGTPSDVNISLWPGEINADTLFAGMAASVKADLERAWSRLGLPDSARLRVVDRLFGMGQDGIAVPVDGSYLAGLVQVALDSAEGSLATLHHEAIHALRDPLMWGQPYGLFTEAEWTALEREARQSWATKHRIAEKYPDLKPAAQIEEAIAAEFAARSRAGSEPEAAPLRRALRKVRTFLRALGRALRGAGLQDADAVFGKIMSGEVGRRGSTVERNADGTFASHAVKYSRRLLAGEGPVTGAAERGIIGQMLTDAMGGRSSRYSILALVPGEPLYQELAKDLGSARTYLRLKHDMSAMRNHMQAEAAKIMDQWRGFLSRNRKANDALMDLMHDATKVGLDPAAPFSTRKRRTRETQAEFDAFVAGRRIEYEALRARWDAMPDRAQEIYRKVRDAYVEVARTERDIIEQNISEAMAINLKRARQAYEDELTRIDEDGLEGDERMEAQEAAAEAYAAVKKRDGYGRASRLRELRQKLESNQVEAPYFPLLRHGQYFVTVKDSEGRLVSFTKAESEREQTRIAAEARKEFTEGHEVVTGLMGAQEAAPDVDPLFVADVEKIIGQTINDPALMDAIWQRYLESLPDFSIRKSRLHRKGTPGYARDAFRNFARQMFHSAHQLARLKQGMKMQMALDDAEREAQRADDPNRAMAIVNEMGLRHDWIMNPKTAAWSTWATGAAFIYYLGVTPAAALVNLSQTVIVGIPVLAAAFKKGGALRASRHLMRGLKEFGTGRGAVENAKTLTDDERAAIREAYDRGIVDKSQAHDLAGVAESGVEYSDIRQRVMAPIAFFFHHAERLNREITFIAAYRMARQDGLEHQQAIDKAGQLTWKTHFNYESDSRPRVQQDDFVRVLTVFRNFQLNMLYRLFRDTHQSFKGTTPEERQMARAQLFGITGLMMLSAGVTGTWGYSLLMTLAGMIVPGADSDDLEKELRNGLVNMLGADLAGMILKGVPGHLTGIDLTNRLGMPDLWFRSPDRQLEGDDLYTYWAQQFLGAVPGMAQNLFRGVDLAAGGDPWRGVETAAPKFIRDLMRGWRYSQDGVTTISGNTILERVPPLDALTQALGFTPAQISERYEQNRWMMNENVQIQNARSSVLTAVWQDVRDGGPISARTMEQIETFNTDNPDYPIDAATIRRSVQSRRRGATETLGGVRLNNRIEARIRANAPVSIYGAAP